MRENLYKNHYLIDNSLLLFSQPNILSLGRLGKALPILSLHFPGLLDFPKLYMNNHIALSNVPVYYISRNFHSYEDGWVRSKRSLITSKCHAFIPSMFPPRVQVCFPLPTPVWLYHNHAVRVSPDHIHVGTCL